METNQFNEIEEAIFCLLRALRQHCAELKIELDHAIEAVACKLVRECLGRSKLLIPLVSERFAVTLLSIKSEGRLADLQNAINCKDSVIQISHNGALKVFSPFDTRYSSGKNVLFSADCHSIDSRRNEIYQQGVELLINRNDCKIYISENKNCSPKSSSANPGNTLDLARQVIENMEKADDNQSDIEARLLAAYKAGRLYERFNVVKDYSAQQIEIASKERKKGLTAIYDKLKSMKHAGQKPKDLWPEFVSMLKDKNNMFDNVLERAGNHHNCKSRSVTFSILPDHVEGKLKDETITYERFSRRLNEK